MPGDALLRYTVPMPSDSLIPGKAIEKLALNDPVLVSVHRSPPLCMVDRTGPGTATSSASISAI